MEASDLATTKIKPRKVNENKRHDNSACPLHTAVAFTDLRIASAPPTRDHSVIKQSRSRAMYLSGESILVILVVGLVAGWLAGKIVRGAGFGLIGDIAIGIVGAFIASWLLPRLGISLGAGIVRAIINSTIGAVLLLLIVRLVRGGGRW
jgi:uncharacterized membrane protein YeaQ/YmgE (transglycosylase-associated protein family)